MAETLTDIQTNSPATSIPSDIILDQNTDLGFNDGATARFDANLAAIRILKQLAQENRKATPTEQAILLKYSGFGDSAFEQAFQDSQYSAAWRERAKQLHDYTTDEEYRAISASRLNAFYTTPTIINMMWQGLRKLGIDNIANPRILEPSAGSGRFLGFQPPELAAKSERIAIEQDTMTGAILKNLYPNTGVYVMGFEETPIADNSIDVAISNVPFGNYPVYDPSFKRDRSKLTKQIHNYFFANTLEKLRPGGVLAFITTHGTLDAKSHKDIRAMLAEKADLVSAIRLPEGAFPDTKVVTDIIFMRKRLPDDKPGNQDWIDTATQTFKDKYGDDVALDVNKYFINNPQMVLGTSSAKRSQYADDSYTVLPFHDKTLAESLEGILKLMPADVITQSNISKTDIPIIRSKNLLNSTNVYNGSYVLQNGNLMVVKLGQLAETGLSKEQQNKVKDMLKVRDAGRVVLNLQLQEALDTDIKDAQTNLNDVYNKFVSDYGPLNASHNADLMIDDPDGAFLKALERWDSDISETRSNFRSVLEAYGAKNLKELQDMLLGAKQAVPIDTDFVNRLQIDLDKIIEYQTRINIVKKLNASHSLDSQETETIKSDIFHKIVVHGLGKHDINDLADAITVSLNDLGRMDLNYMAKISGLSFEYIRDELAKNGQIYKNPIGDWEPADQYLSGDVKNKLKQAQIVAAVNPAFLINVKALEAVQPGEILPSEISVRLGTTWIPASDVNEFVTFLLNPYIHVYGKTLPHNYFQYIPETAKWEKNDAIIGVSSSKMRNEWGTEEVPATEILISLLNGKNIEVKDKDDSGHLKKDDKGKPVRDDKATVEVQDKMDAIQEAFKNWIWADPARSVRLAKYYNDTFNCFRSRLYDGKHQSLPGMENNWVKKLRLHQKDAIWRVVQDRTALLAHEVGFGKSQPHDAKILTPQGWKLMGEINVGDEVIGADGKPTIVIGVFPQGIRPIYRIQMSDGASTECTNEHLWLTWTFQERTNFGHMVIGKNWECAKPHVRQLSEIKQTLKAHKIQAKNHSIPLVNPVMFPERDLPLEPYLFGLLLGDGNLSNSPPRFSCGDEEILNSVKELIPLGVHLSKQNQYDYRLSTGFKWSGSAHFNKNPITATMRHCGLSGCLSYDKFIPDDYKFSSPSQRIALLQGIMDTDGTVFKNGMAITHSTTSHQLAKDVRYLVQSLGGTATIREKKPHYTYKGEKRNGHIAYETLLRLPTDIKPFRLKRKAQRVKGFTKYPPIRYITSVDLVGSKPASCILVDNESHLYVTDDFIVTHNTAVMVSSGMELRRLGLSRKNVYVVPKATHAQFRKQFLDIYPYAKVLFPNEDDFTPTKRPAFIAKALTGDWDAIILTNDQFYTLPVKPETEQKFIAEEIDSLIEALNSTDDKKHKNDIEKAVKNLQVKLAETTEAIHNKSQHTVYFEDMGIDQLFVDEADNFKNLHFATNLTRVKGLPNSNSKRSWDMYQKIRYLQSQGKNTGIVFATGTPIANTIAEMYTMMRYLQPDMLEAKGLKHFDAWRKTFGETTSTLEQTVTGKYVDSKRFAKFLNVPELSQLWQECADIRIASENPEVQKEQPRLVDEHGKSQRTVTASDPDKALLDYMDTLIKRADLLPYVDKKEDNMLKIANDARLASLDVRMKVPTAPVNPNNKIGNATAKIAEIYKETNDNKGVQLVFLDLGTPKAKDAQDDDKEITEDTESSEDTEEFTEDTQVLKDMYSIIKQMLIAKGIPANEIAFIHDAKTPKQKERLSDKLNSGSIRVVIGSTGKLGVGLNIQKRAAALHHLDAPWRPRDLEQREGRIIRPGNLIYGPQFDREGNIIDAGKGVRIYNYVMQRSFDAYMWQTVEAKAKAIKSIMRRDKPPRILEDVDSFTMTAGQAKALASGNPDVMRQVQLQNDVLRLQMLKLSYDDSIFRAKQQLVNLPGMMAITRNKIDQLSKDIKLAKSAPPEFVITIKGKNYTERDKAIEILSDEIVKTLSSEPKSAESIGTYNGFELKPVRNAPEEGGGYKIYIHNPETNSYYATTYFESDNITSHLVRITNTINNISKRLDEEQRNLTDEETNLKTYTEQVNKEFAYKDKLDKSQQALSLVERRLRGEHIESGEEAEDIGTLTAEPLPSEPVGYKYTDKDNEPLYSHAEGQSLGAALEAGVSGVKKEEIKAASTLTPIPISQASETKLPSESIQQVAHETKHVVIETKPVKEPEVVVKANEQPLPTSVSVKYGSYNARRYSKPWISKVVSWTEAEGNMPGVKWGTYYGDDNGGEVSISAIPGDIIRHGQKDFRGGNSTKDWFVVKNDGSLININMAQAHAFYLANLQKPKTTPVKESIKAPVAETTPILSPMPALQDLIASDKADIKEIDQQKEKDKAQIANLQSNRAAVLESRPPEIEKKPESKIPEESKTIIPQKGEHIMFEASIKPKIETGVKALELGEGFKPEPVKDVAKTEPAIPVTVKQATFEVIAPEVPAIVMTKTISQSLQELDKQKKEMLSAIRRFKPGSLTIGKHIFDKEIIDGDLFYTRGKERYTDSELAPTQLGTEQGRALLEKAKMIEENPEYPKAVAEKPLPGQVDMQVPKEPAPAIAPPVVKAKQVPYKINVTKHGNDIEVHVIDTRYFDSRVSSYGWVIVMNTGNEWKAAHYDDDAKFTHYIAETDTKTKALNAAKAWAQKQIDRDYPPSEPPTIEVAAEKPMQPVAIVHETPLEGAVTPNTPDSYVQAIKRPDGKWQLYFTGTRNEVFPNKLFSSKEEARMAFKVSKAKSATSVIEKPELVMSSIISSPQKPETILQSPEVAKPLPGQLGMETAPVAKKPWQITREKYASDNWQSYLQRFRDRPDILDTTTKEKELNDYRQLHVNAVAKALSEGKPVPPEVLKDYPEMAKRAQAQAVTPAVAYTFAILKERLNNTKTSAELKILDDETEENYQAFKDGLSYDEKNRFNDLFAERKQYLKDTELKATNPEKYYQDKIDQLQYEKLRAQAIEDTTEAAYTFATKQSAGRERKRLEKEIAELESKKLSRPSPALAVKPAPAEAPPVAKEPWQMTREEFRGVSREAFNRDGSPSYYFLGVDDKSSEAAVRWHDEVKRLTGKLTGEEILKDPWGHEKLIQQALSEGKPVPAEVLKDYPAMAKPAQATVTPPETPITPAPAIKPAPITPAPKVEVVAEKLTQHKPIIPPVAKKKDTEDLIALTEMLLQERKRQYVQPPRKPVKQATRHNNGKRRHKTSTGISRF